MNSNRCILEYVQLTSRANDGKDDDPEANLRREKEARVIRDYIRKTYPVGSGHEFLILGDFNDFKHSAPRADFSPLGQATRQ